MRLVLTMKAFVVVFLTSLFLLGCSSSSVQNKTATLGDIQELSQTGGNKCGITAIRTQGLRDAALSISARGGLAWRAKQINAVLSQHEKMLSRVFNFYGMLLEKNVLPPVLIEGRNSLNLGGTDTIRLADRNYQILTQAKFVTAPPTWRDYLWLAYKTPETPDRSLLPKNREERFMWKKFTEEGWKAGVQQADLIFSETMGRLKRDYEGMIRYRTLLAQNIVSPPFVAELEMGVTGGGKELNVNDRVLRITAFPALQADSSTWKTEIIPHE